ncbi:hypothetical protein DFH27DRAFT_387807 [Peziza echinospora]|nr:hypothetical protein DFH27DRAFT_387807 [Peziza echinospora]
MHKPHTLQEILIQASTHPYYINLLTPEQQAQSPTSLTLPAFPFLTKDHLFAGIAHLLATDPTFLHGIYISPTGGTRSVINLFNFTCSRENRQIRKHASRLIRVLGLLGPTDIVANLHEVTRMYQSQSLSAAIIEYAEATNLNITVSCQDADVVGYGEFFKPTAVFALPSRVVQLARYVKEERIEWGARTGRPMDKMLYTSETLSREHEVFVAEALGIKQVGSLYGSAELGPCAASPLRPVLTREDLDPETTTRPELGYREFVVDRKLLLVEVLDDNTGEILASSENPVVVGGEEEKEQDAAKRKGELVFTSMLKFRHPIVRYRTGDIGSIHPYTGPLDLTIKGSGTRDDYFIFRLYGRIPQKSFTVDGEYIDIQTLQKRCLSKPEFDVLEWQVILDRLAAEEVETGEAHDTVEFRIVTAGDVGEDYEDVVTRTLIKDVFGPNLKVTVRRVSYSELERGRNAGKMLKIIDRRSA